MSKFSPLLLFFLSLAISAGLIVLLQPWLRRYALVQPNARSSHQCPTPQGAGIAVLAATIAALSFGGLFIPSLEPVWAWPLWPVFAVTVFIAMVGAADDIRAIAVGPRLLLQIIAVALLVAALPDDLRVWQILPWWVERGLLLVAGVWFVNLVNFMDGIDWMTVAEVVPITAGLVLIGAFGGLPMHATAVALSLGGAVIGFAPFNRPVAKIFLGDVGSLPIGLLLGWLLLQLAGHGHPAAALLLPLYYLADATVTLARRLLNGEKVWRAHRTHFYQRATDAGLTVPQIVGRVFVVNFVLVGLALATILMPSLAISIATLALGGVLVTWLLFSFVRGKQ